jgi:hypothetical protein
VRDEKQVITDICKELTRQLEETRTEIALLRKEQEKRDEQERIIEDIWGPITRPRPDVTWDPPPVLLSEVDSERPVTLNGVATELGLKLDDRELAAASSRVQELYEGVHGRLPEPRVFYDEKGRAQRVGCFTQRDRRILVRCLTGDDVD